MIKKIEESSEEGFCLARTDAIHCVHWWDGEPCCSCGAEEISVDPETGIPISENKKEKS